MEDGHFMRAALALARRGLGTAWPNPTVGCVLVKDGEVVGRGGRADRVRGRDANYDVRVDAAVEAIREQRGTYVRGGADVVWEFLRTQPSREGGARRGGPPVRGIR